MGYALLHALWWAKELGVFLHTIISSRKKGVNFFYFLSWLPQIITHNFIWSDHQPYESSGLLHVCYAHIHTCQPHLNPAIGVLSLFHLILCLFAFLIAFCFSLCRAKTQTALHTPKHWKPFYLQNVVRLTEGKQRGSICFLRKQWKKCARNKAFLPCAGLLGAEGNWLTQISFLFYKAGVK